MGEARARVELFSRGAAQRKTDGRTTSTAQLSKKQQKTAQQSSAAAQSKDSTLSSSGLT